MVAVNDIPQGRGMGSSAAAVVAGVVGAWALCPDVDGIDDDAVLRLTTELEGHPDNVAPCLLGGATLSWMDAGRRPRGPAGRRAGRRARASSSPARRCPRTSPAGCCPTSSRTRDAAYNAARSALLVHALTSDPALLFEATDDRLHQRQRAAAMPESIALVDRLRADGHAAVVSGAGPSVLVLGRGDGRTGPRSPHSLRRSGRSSPSRWMRSGQRCWSGRLRYLLGNEEHTGTHRCCPVRELRLGSRRSRPLGRASRGAEADDLSSPLIRLASFRPVPFCVPASGPDRKGPGHPLRWNAQVTAGKDLYVSETTDLVATGSQDAAGASEASAASGTTGSARRRGNGLSGMLLPELQRLAGELGISGTGRMRKGDLVAAISARQVGGSAPAGTPSIETPRRRGPGRPGCDLVRSGRGPRQRRRRQRPAERPGPAPRPPARCAPVAAPAARPVRRPPTPRPTRPRPWRPPRVTTDTASAPADGERTEGDRPQRNRERGGRVRTERDGGDRARPQRSDRGSNDRNAPGTAAATTAPPPATAATRDGGNRGPDRGDRNDSRGGRPDNRTDGPRGANPNDDDDDDFEGGRGRRGRRYRDRNRRGGSARRRSGGGRERFDQGEPTVSDDDVLLPVAGILDVLDNYAFVRTSGYLTGPERRLRLAVAGAPLRPAPR